MAGHVLLKLTNTKFRGNLFNGSRVVPGVQTEELTERLLWAPNSVMHVQKL
jgi:hypothetical protein